MSPPEPTAYPCIGSQNRMSAKALGALGTVCRVHEAPPSRVTYILPFDVAAQPWSASTNSMPVTSFAPPPWSRFGPEAQLRPPSAGLNTLPLVEPAYPG